MRRRSMRAVLIFMLFYVGLGALLTWQQERLVYHPNDDKFAACPHFTAAETIAHQGTRMYVTATSGPVVVLYHGNAGSACDRAPYASIFHNAGYGSVLVEYAGFSDSTMRPTHERIREDVKNVIDYLTEHAYSPIVVAGESLGTGVASYHASRAAPDALLLVSPFTDLQALAAHHYWYYPTDWLVENAYDNVATLQEYTGPAHIIHGTDDTIIPITFGRVLADTLPSERITVTAVAGAHHNDILAFPETHSAVRAAVIEALE